MELKITTQGLSDEIHLFQKVPQDLQNYTIPGAIGIGASGSFGNLLFQQIDGDGFCIWNSNYLIENNTTFKALSNESVLELHFKFCKVEYRLEGIGDVSMYNGQFNITYTPFINNIVSLYGGHKYHTFDIHLSLNLLQQFADESPELSIFLNSIESIKSANITNHHHFATIEMITSIKSILQNHYQGKTREVFIKTKVMDLIIMVIDKIAHDRVIEFIKLKANDIESIYAARDYLLKNMDNPLSIIQLSRKVGINDYKLKKGFKMIFGKTIFDYLLDAKMDKAMIMVRETNVSIDEIAHIVGFSFVSNFSIAFRKKFGFSPLYFRKK